MPISQGSGIGAVPIGGTGGTGGTGGPTNAVANAVTPLPNVSGVVSAQIVGAGNAVTPLALAVGLAYTNNQTTAVAFAATPLPGVSGSAAGALPSQSLYFVLSTGDVVTVAFASAPVVNFVPL
jgi:hypothetical protein